MSITYNDTTFDVVDNGDGTFTLTPTAAFSAEALIAEYRELRGETRRTVGYKQKLAGKVADTNAKLTDLRARRDELKVLLEAAGNEPDADEVVE